MKTTYTVPEIRKILNVSKTTSYAFANSGEFETVVINNSIRVKKESFDRWLASHPKYSKRIKAGE